MNYSIHHSAILRADSWRRVFSRRLAFWLAICLTVLAGQMTRAEGEVESKRPELWFPVGEVLIYSVKWGVWTVAETRDSSEYIEEGGRELLAIRIATRTRNLMAGIYPVNDFLESVVDPETFLPVRFTKKLSEGRYHTHEVTTFDHKAGKMQWHSYKRNADAEHPIEADTRDLISFMFYARQKAFEVNRQYNFQVMADEKMYELIVKSQKIERFKVGRFGKVRSLKLRPEAKFHGLFVRVGELDVWISDDTRCLCTRAVAKAPIIGSITLQIDRVEGPGDDFWTHPGDSSYKQVSRSRPADSETDRDEPRAEPEEAEDQSAESDLPAAAVDAEAAASS